MAYTRIQRGREAVYGIGQAQAVAANSFACESGMFLKVITSGSNQFIGKALAGDTIEGVSSTEKTYESNNQTVKQEMVNYTPKIVVDWNIQVTGQSIVFDADLITGNTVDLMINGVAMTQVPFNTDNDTTMADLAAQILSDFGSTVQFSVAAGTPPNQHTILITPIGSNDSVVISNIVVAGGASQAAATVSALAPTAGDWNKYYDLTDGQYIDMNSESTSSGQFQLTSVDELIFEIANR